MGIFSTKKKTTKGKKSNSSSPAKKTPSTNASVKDIEKFTDIADASLATAMVDKHYFRSLWDALKHEVQPGSTDVKRTVFSHADSNQKFSVYQNATFIAGVVNDNKPFDFAERLYWSLSKFPDLTDILADLQEMNGDGQWETPYADLMSHPDVKNNDALIQEIDEIFLSHSLETALALDNLLQDESNDFEINTELMFDERVKKWQFMNFSYDELSASILDVKVALQEMDGILFATDNLDNVLLHLSSNEGSFGIEPIDAFIYGAASANSSFSFLQDHSDGFLWYRVLEIIEEHKNEGRVEIWSKKEDDKTQFILPSIEVPTDLPELSLEEIEEEPEVEEVEEEPEVEEIIDYVDEDDALLELLQESAQALIDSIYDVYISKFVDGLADEVVSVFGLDTTEALAIDNNVKLENRLLNIVDDLINAEELSEELIKSLAEEVDAVNTLRHQLLTSINEELAGRTDAVELQNVLRILIKELADALGIRDSSDFDFGILPDAFDGMYFGDILNQFDFSTTAPIFNSLVKQFKFNPLSLEFWVN